MKYRQVDDLTSDVLFEVYGKDLKELFENAAEALFSLMCDIENVSAIDDDEVSASGKDLEDTMFNWLNTLIAQVDTEEKFYSKFDVSEISETNVKAKISGEEITPSKGAVVVKSVTLYKFKVEKTDDGYKAMFSVDI